MKRKLITLCLVMLALAGVHLNAVPLGTAFTYQGRLADGANPAHGRYDLQWAVYDAAALGNRIGNIVTNTAVAVSDGLFSVSLDFGANIFTGNACWLALGVRSNGVAGNFTPMDPRQPMTAAPHALHALTAGAVANDSVMASQFKTPGAPGAGQVLTYDGSSLVWQTLAAATGAWAVGGNNVSGGNFLGTLNNLPMEVRVNNSRVLRLEPTTGAPNVILGDGGNTVSAGVIAASIGGGTGHSVAGDHSTVAGGNGNSAGSNAGFVGGGSLNHANGSSSTLAGGYDNTVTGGVAFIGGGARNRANNNFSAIAGGENNTTSGDYSTVSGGGRNTASGPWSSVAGGSGNQAVGYYATVPGGVGNLANGDFSFAAGYSARANHPGCFIWADSYLGPPPHPAEVPFSSIRNDEFAVRANGGVRLVTPTLTVSGTTTTGILTITGGSDVAEPFQMSMPEIPKGAVVVIDEENAGKLKLSDHPYDYRVAGIVSGANGINPGIALHQEGALEGGQNVALTGRVYVQADATSNPIKPGDLLTSSDTPGHAMKVTDHKKAQGAIIGKAMSVLKEGRGMVLVLVSLQ